MVKLEMTWVEATPPSAPVNPTNAVLSPTIVGMSTAWFVVTVAPLMVSLKVAFRRPAE